MKFAKMEGLGNDFIITHNCPEEEVYTIVKNIPNLCDRRKGIGADGIIFVLSTTAENSDFRMRIFNSDGSEAEMCGNGIRCFTVYLHEMNISRKQSFAIETNAGIIRTEFHEKKIRVDMGNPELKAELIPTSKSNQMVIMEPISIGDREFKITAVSMGNPHSIIYVDEITDDLVINYGSKIESHSFFPNRVNVEFIKVLSDSEIEMRVYERGCGETMACGTGACAAVVAGILNKRHGNKVTVHLRGGDLNIEWDGDSSHSVFMTGPAKLVFKGEYEL